ncbi:MAG: PQQ-binding-like beta-propeller repeat protein [Sedimentisphaerales bacterium]|nr:PQQ-binding-like beta-propeller repeat protein [Sedimentisphaerales bacterium]
MQRKFFFFVCLISCSLTVLSNGPVQGSTVLLPAVLLDKADLKMNWQVNLPVLQTEKAQKIFGFDKYLYVLLDSNFLFCIDKEKGSVRFDLQLTAPGLPITNCVYHDEMLCFMVGNELVVVNPYNGAIKQKRKLKLVGNVVDSMAVNSSFIYLVGKSRINVMVADEFWRKFMVTADNDSKITSIAADERNLFFATIEGNVVCSFAEAPKKKWQYDITGKITAPITIDGKSLYVGSEDTKLYKLSSLSGKSQWKSPFQARAPITETPRVGEKVVYLSALSKGLYAVDKVTGEGIWNIPEAKDILTEIDDKAYVFAEPELLVIMNNTTGKEVSRINFTGVTNYAVNTADSTIYVSSRNGRVVSIGKKIYGNQIK